MGTWNLNEDAPHRPTGSGTITRFVLLGVDVTCWRNMSLRLDLLKDIDFD